MENCEEKCSFWADTERQRAGLHWSAEWTTSAAKTSRALKPSVHLSWAAAVCLPELSIDPDGPFRHLSIFNQPPPLTQQLPPNWFEIDHHQHHNGGVGLRRVLIKILRVKLNHRCMLALWGVWSTWRIEDDCRTVSKWCHPASCKTEQSDYQCSSYITVHTHWIFFYLLHWKALGSVENSPIIMKYRSLLIYLFIHCLYHVLELHLNQDNTQQRFPLLTHFGAFALNLWSTAKCLKEFSADMKQTWITSDIFSQPTKAKESVSSMADSFCHF